MKVVWLGWEEVYTTRRVQEAARQKGLDLLVCNIHDISFDTEIYHDGAQRRQRRASGKKGFCRVPSLPSW